ncbi:hypothetical protein GCM10009665_74240 [Kitasatospora nipponensis]|uniref:Uncharacterized protein n=1 Tax=Kitasatospora nipponensis TaxID=258049 RepID=A0ABP4DUA0_9ACTN
MPARASAAFGRSGATRGDADPRAFRAEGKPWACGVDAPSALLRCPGGRAERLTSMLASRSAQQASRDREVGETRPHGARIGEFRTEPHRSATGGRAHEGGRRTAERAARVLGAQPATVRRIPVR